MRQRHRGGGVELPARLRRPPSVALAGRPFHAAREWVAARRAARLAAGMGAHAADLKQIFDLRWALARQRAVLDDEPFHEPMPD